MVKECRGCILRIDNAVGIAGGGHQHKRLALEIDVSISGSGVGSCSDNDVVAADRAIDCGLDGWMLGRDVDVRCLCSGDGCEQEHGGQESVSAPQIHG
jgi:hypothetical protein